MQDWDGDWKSRWLAGRLIDGGGVSPAGWWWRASCLGVCLVKFRDGEEKEMERKKVRGEHSDECTVDSDERAIDFVDSDERAIDFDDGRTVDCNGCTVDSNGCTVDFDRRIVNSDECMVNSSRHITEEGLGI
ncbi:hypothetical protein Droror1_Dr00014329 [Drosera rotundifolia]